MILKLIVSVLPIVVVLLASEILWRKGAVKGERARKLIHIIAGSYMAFWPFYLPFDGIIVLGSMALTLLIYSRMTNLFHAIYAVKRRTYGEIFFALAIVVCAFLGREPWIYMVSVLLLALADGAAAVVGRFYGLTNQYLVFGLKSLKKSVAGTATFLGLAYVIVGLGWLFGGREVIGDNLFVILIILPVGATILENISPYGSDDLFTPLFATLLLNSLL